MYLVVVPSLVRPGQQVNVYVSLFRLIGPSVRVSLSIRREQVEYAGTNEKFTMPGSKILQMKVSEIYRYTVPLKQQGRIHSQCSGWAGQTYSS